MALIKKYLQKHTTYLFLRTNLYVQFIFQFKSTIYHPAITLRSIVASTTLSLLRANSTIHLYMQKSRSRIVIPLEKSDYSTPWLQRDHVLSDPQSHWSGSIPRHRGCVSTVNSSTFIGQAKVNCWWSWLKHFSGSRTNVTNSRKLWMQKWEILEVCEDYLNNIIFGCSELSIIQDMVPFHMLQWKGIVRVLKRD